MTKTIILYYCSNSLIIKRFGETTCHIPDKKAKNCSWITLLIFMHSKIKTSYCLFNSMKNKTSFKLGIKRAKYTLHHWSLDLSQARVLHSCNNSCYNHWRYLHCKISLLLHCICTLLFCDERFCTSTDSEFSQFSAMTHLDTWLVAAFKSSTEGRDYTWLVVVILKTARKCSK